MAQFYFDDPDIGPARETSHPELVRACEDELFYDCTDQLGPFGNDEGADTLYALEDWYREGARGTLRSFIDGLLEKWGASQPDLATTDRDVVFSWLDDDELTTNLVIVDHVVSATAFGQAKISGKVDASVADLARAALDREGFMVEHSLRRDPTWKFAPDATRAVELMRAGLDKLERNPAR